MFSKNVKFWVKRPSDELQSAAADKYVNKPTTELTDVGIRCNDESRPSFHFRQRQNVASFRINDHRLVQWMKRRASAYL